MHFLVIPKYRDGLTQLSNSTEKNEPVLGHILHVASKVGTGLTPVCTAAGR